MRILSFVFLFIFAVNISAQSMNIDDLYTQGTRQFNGGRFEEALSTYKTTLATAEKKYAGKEYLARLHYNIGACYFHLDRFEAAVKEFKGALLLKTDYSQAYVALDKTRERIRDSHTAALVKEK